MPATQALSTFSFIIFSSNSRGVRPTKVPTTTHTGVRKGSKWDGMCVFLKLYKHKIIIAFYVHKSNGINSVTVTEN